jgi:WD40 repeat protein
MFWATEETGTIHQWEAKTGMASGQKDFIRPPYRCQGCVQSGDGSRFFVLLMNAPDDDPRNVKGFECRVVDHNFAVLNTIALPERPLAIGASHDGERCAFSYGTRFIIYETNSGSEVASVRNLYGQVSHFAFSPDGKRLLTSAFTQGLYVFDFGQAQ